MSAGVLYGAYKNMCRRKNIHKIVSFTTTKRAWYEMYEQLRNNSIDIHDYIDFVESTIRRPYFSVVSVKINNRFKLIEQYKALRKTEAGKQLYTSQTRQRDLTKFINDYVETSLLYTEILLRTSYSKQLPSLDEFGGSIGYMIQTLSPIYVAYLLGQGYYSSILDNDIDSKILELLKHETIQGYFPLLYTIMEFSNQELVENYMQKYRETYSLLELLNDIPGNSILTFGDIGTGYINQHVATELGVNIDEQDY